MKHSVKHLFHINASREKVFEAISTIEGLSGWWTIKTTGSAAIGGILKFRFAEVDGPDMKVTELKPNEKLTWECVASPHGWFGNTLTFELDENDGKTRVRFAHHGWEEQNDSYAICSFAWGRYMESLRQLCQSGKGEAFGTEQFRK